MELWHYGTFLSEELIYNLALVIRKVFKIQGPLSCQVQLKKFKIEFLEFLKPLLVIIDSIHKGIEIDDFFPGLELRRGTACIL